MKIAQVLTPRAEAVEAVAEEAEVVAAVEEAWEVAVSYRQLHLQHQQNSHSKLNSQQLSNNKHLPSQQK